MNAIKRIIHTVVTAHFRPKGNKWSGFAVEMNKPGTHKEYNILYNGECVNEYFNTEERAKKEATKYIKPNK